MFLHVFIGFVLFFQMAKARKYDLCRGWKVNYQKIKLSKLFQINQIHPFLLFYEHGMHEICRRPTDRGSKGTEVFRISCFRHLEKPIKTKENKVKHLFLYVFIGFVLFF